MRLPNLVVPLLLALSIAGCHGTAVDQPLDQPFELAVGNAVHLTTTDLTVAFVRVDADSRCPRGVQCITAGEAQVRLAAGTAKQAADDVVLRLPGGADASDWVPVHGYALRLVTLEPEPAAGVRTDSTAYVATLVVRRGS
jgi:hypothetical protein